MDALTDQNLLLAWEQGCNRPLLEKSLALLALAYPDYNGREVATWSIGERDARLLRLREKFFGRQLNNAATCPACGQRTEWQASIEAFQLQPIGKHAEPVVIEVTYDEALIRFRLPTSADLLELLSADHPSAGPDELIQKCIVQSNHPATNNGKIPDELKSLIINKMEEIDPQADITIQLSCPECGHEWLLSFDIMHYLWTEIDDWAYRTLRDIGLLAFHFGWSEKEILEMSRFRRHLYVNMING